VYRQDPRARIGVPLSRPRRRHEMHEIGTGWNCGTRRGDCPLPRFRLPKTDSLREAAARLGIDLNFMAPFKQPAG
jgi:hypothetical protein